MTALILLKSTYYHNKNTENTNTLMANKTQILANIYVMPYTQDKYIKLVTSQSNNCGSYCTNMQPSLNIGKRENNKEIP